MPAYPMNAQDEAHLGLISVFHFVMGGLYLLGVGFLIMHFIIMNLVFHMAENQSSEISLAPVVVVTETPAPTTRGEVAMPESLPAPTPPPARTPAPFPKEIIPIFIAFYVIAGAFLVTLCVCNVLSGLYIRKRKNRMFSFIVAGMNCLQVPFGTALGVFTFIVLSRVPVKMSYDANLLV